MLRPLGRPVSLQSGSHIALLPCNGHEQRRELLINWTLMGWQRCRLSYLCNYTLPQEGMKHFSRRTPSKISWGLYLQLPYVPHFPPVSHASLVSLACPCLALAVPHGRSFAISPPQTRIISHAYYYSSVPRLMLIHPISFHFHPESRHDLCLPGDRWWPRVQIQLYFVFHSRVSMFRS